MLLDRNANPDLDSNLDLDLNLNLNLWSQRPTLSVES
jgi:hypothetical protein